MKLVVEIPEEQYITLNAKSQEEVVAVIDNRILINAIKNGTPLPKGHGRLIDADELLKHKHTIGTSNYCEYNVVYVETIKEAPTIIEADKEQEDGND